MEGQRIEKVQTRILQRITNLELSLLPDNFSNSLSPRPLPLPLTPPPPPPKAASPPFFTLTASMTSSSSNGFYYYYNWPLKARCNVLGAASINHLCKSIFLYTARFNAETVKNFLYAPNIVWISKKKFNSKLAVRLAPEEVSVKLTGGEHNGVTCIGMETNIPAILDEAIVKLNPDFFWLGGGEVDLKLGIRTIEFVNFVKPFIVNCSGT